MDCLQFKRIGSDLSASWDEAKEMCEEVGGELSYFNNATEYEMWTSQLGLEPYHSTSHWLGIKRLILNPNVTDIFDIDIEYEYINSAGDKQEFISPLPHNNFPGLIDCLQIYIGILTFNEDCDRAKHFSCRFDNCSNNGEGQPFIFENE